MIKNKADIEIDKMICELGEGYNFREYPDKMKVQPYYQSLTLRFGVGILHCLRNKTNCLYAYFRIKNKTQKY